MKPHKAIIKVARKLACRTYAVLRRNPDMGFHNWIVNKMHNNGNISRTDFSYYNDHSLALMSP